VLRYFPTNSVIFIVLSRKLANSKKFVTKKIITYLIAAFMLLTQYIFAHSIGFAICKIVVVRIANAYIHGVRIANPHGRKIKELFVL
jgi:hypothetical protein